MSIGKIIESVGFLTAVLAVNFLFCLNIVKAENKIDVEYPVGTNIDGNKIFSENNILPGWETTETIRVENDSMTDDVSLFFAFDVNGDKKLAEKLKLYVIRVADGSYRIGGSGDRYDLNEADNKELYVDRLSATKGKEYRIKIKFNEDAGNEYQGLATDCDIEFKIESDEIDNRTEVQILADQGRANFTGEEPEVEGETVAPEEVVVGDSGESENNPQVAGINDQCNQWPWWNWVLILIGYLVVFYKTVFIKRREEKSEILWKWQVAMTVLTIIFWWHFDSCREYSWFLFGSLGGSGINYGWFWLKRKEIMNNK